MVVLTHSGGGDFPNPHQSLITTVPEQSFESSTPYTNSPFIHVAQGVPIGTPPRFCRRPKISRNSDTSRASHGSAQSDHVQTTCSGGSWNVSRDGVLVDDFAVCNRRADPVPKSVEDIINGLPRVLCGNIPITRKIKTVFEDYELLKEVGSGTYAKVYKLQHKKTGEISAGKFLKPFRFPRNTERRVVQMFINEISLLARTQCPGTVKMNAVVWSCDGVLVDLEYIDGGTIWREKVCPTSESRWRHMIQLLQGVQHIHDCGVVHRDLKPTNILRDSQCQLKIADFGWAEEIQKLKPTNREWPGTLEINPPEVLNFTGPLTEKIDNYALGMNFLLFVSNRFVCRQKGLSVGIAVPVILKMVENIRKPSSKMQPNFVSENWGVFLGLTEPEPKRRWSINQVLHHPWMVRGFMDFAETAPPGAIDSLLWLDSTRRAFEMYRIPRSLNSASPSKSRSLFQRVLCAPRSIFDWSDHNVNQSPQGNKTWRDDEHSSGRSARTVKPQTGSVPARSRFKIHVHGGGGDHPQSVDQASIWIADDNPPGITTQAKINRLPRRQILTSHLPTLVAQR